MDIFIGGFSMVSELEYDGIELDSQVKLVRFAYGLDNWTELIELSENLYRDALQVYNYVHISDQSVILPKLERTLVYYIGISKLMQGLAFQKLGNYKEAHTCILIYSHWDWVNAPDEASKKDISSFIHLARLNKRVLDILQGDSSQVDSYIDYIQEDDRELTAGLLTLLEANRMHKIDLNSIEHLLVKQATEQVAATIIDSDRPAYLKFLYEYTLYKIRDGLSFDAINILLNCLSINTKFKIVSTSLIKYIYLFEISRDSASTEQITRYQSILKGVMLNEETKINV